VATTEGGAITGEERLREHMGYVYGAILSTEDKPTPYQLARLDTLERELTDVERDFTSLQATELADANAGLKAKGLPPIAVQEPAAAPSTGGGGATKQVVEGLVGLRFFGNMSAQASREENERD